ncbi:MAG TPA: tyrosine--tRNA ligase [Candidatus Dadabacteria bacterium]|jgi:tyrosyl-tRNA synthetase|nr:tyrosine--tRNA ligase [Candidatus Dadabacteria bacterium]
MEFLEPEEQLETIKNDVGEAIPENELLEKLKFSYDNNTPLKIKAGFDPTTSNLHLGHSLLLRKLKVFQALGHKIFFLIGDFTAKIGDPTNRDKTRPSLDEGTINKNAATYKDQLFKILEEDNVEILYNSKWFNDFDLSNLIKLASLENVARLLERDDFKKRYKSGEAITVTEFLYPILQAYDSVVLECDIEVGGTDQIFNVLLGRQIQKAYNIPQQVGVFVPILEGLDGKMKMSKTLNNHISLNDPPEEIFGKIMSISDSLMTKYIELLYSDRNDLFREILNPLERKKTLGHTIVSEYYDKSSADLSQKLFEKKFTKKDFPDDIPRVEIKLKDKNLLDILVEISRNSFSRSELKRLIKNKAIEINKNTLSSLDYLPDNETEWRIRIGKRNFYKAKLV